MMGGDKSRQVRPDEWLLAAVSIYTDVINLFMAILEIMQLAGAAALERHSARCYSTRGGGSAFSTRASMSSAQPAAAVTPPL